ncbi:hypothetical protein [Alicyclobacillus fastidiosus]|uniref:Uncharacterized protein n=1 Tax=Alicyclobacillus fastidiosus TaxID=392011 RepID=A0ABV5A8V0_9BACL|nr:hypothetical protein [Alicyclobacillus fastidiosus]WEH10652.1 hypothetical protein PYS47_05355 [Alicyclobacillus fastidiosus]
MNRDIAGEAEEIVERLLRNLKKSRVGSTERESNKLGDFSSGDQVSVTTGSGTTYTGVFSRAFDNKIVIYADADADLRAAIVRETIIDLTGAVVQRMG